MPNGNETLKYPLNIGENGMYPFMHIKINERYLKPDEGFVTDIYTYIPIGIFQNDGMSYGNLERGLIGAGIDALSNGAFSVTAEDLLAASGQFTSSLTNFTGVDLTGGYNAGVAKAGVAMNPSAVTTFESAEVRTFDINLKFICRGAVKIKETAKSCQCLVHGLVKTLESNFVMLYWLISKFSLDGRAVKKLWYTANARCMVWIAGK